MCNYSFFTKKTQLCCIYFLVLLIMNSITHNNLDLRSILSDKGISRTNFRSKLVYLFYSSNRSLSVEEILNYFKNSVNKVTVYRSLESFENKGLIHKVPDIKNLMRYSLCKDECSANSHNHNHGHFICYECNDTFCLDSIKIPEITTLKNFVIKDLKLTMEGYCKNCNTI